MLHRAQMRHRKLNVDRVGKSQPLAATLLDLLVEFIVSHLMKKFPMELYLLCVGIIHRILCYQKRCRVRLNYPWKELWSALIGLLRFLVNQEQTLMKKCNIFHLSLQVSSMCIRKTENHNINQEIFCIFMFFIYRWLTFLICL